ncbi:MAG: hypothetical protein J1E81_02240 [Eubacterium sp.]|nr:hypothetical protein [Eubacterium sp.]
MAKTIPMIVTNRNILVWDMNDKKFKAFSTSTENPSPNIPFYHEYAEKIAESQHYFKEFMKNLYGKKLTKYILAIIVPDDTSRLESIFINEFFVNSGACKAVAQMPMALALSKDDSKYISISKSLRNVTLEYVKNNETVVKKYYDINDCNSQQIANDINVLHIDIEYNEIPVFVNNFNKDMDDFFELGQVISSKEFMDKISAVDVEKL